MSHIIVFSLSVSLSKVTRVKNFGAIAQRTLNTMKDENEDSPVRVRARFMIHSLEFDCICFNCSDFGATWLVNDNFHRSSIHVTVQLQ